MRFAVPPAHSLNRRRIAATAVAVAVGAATALAPISGAAVAADRQHGRVAQHHGPATKTGNGLIAIVRGGKIYTIDAVGGSQTLLVARGGNQRPHFSPDGARIAYIHRNPGAPKGGGWNVWVMNADGTHKRQVTHLGNVKEAQWSPDGAWLAFGPTLSKVRSTAPFGKPIPLLGSPDGEPNQIEVDTSLVWSPNGNQIAYYSHQYPDSPDNYLLVLNIAEQQVDLVWEVGGSCCGEGYFANPAWSNDGAQLSYDQVFWEPEDGQHPTRPNIQIDNYPSRVSVGYPTQLGDKDAEFSPDGTQLLMAHVDRGRLSIMVTDIDGSNRRLITRGTQPDWQPVPSGT